MKAKDHVHEYQEHWVWRSLPDLRHCPTAGSTGSGKSTWLSDIGPV